MKTLACKNVLTLENASVYGQCVCVCVFYGVCLLHCCTGIRRWSI